MFLAAITLHFKNEKKEEFQIPDPNQSQHSEMKSVHLINETTLNNFLWFCEILSGIRMIELFNSHVIKCRRMFQENKPHPLISIKKILLREATLMLDIFELCLELKFN